MHVDIDDIVARYGVEIAHLTQRAIIAEARADQAEKQLAQTGATDA